MNTTNTIAISESVEIPMSEIDFQFSPSRGPGGQHVNRSNTRATLLFDVAKSPSLDEQTRKHLLQELDSRLDKQGVLHITSQDTRSQTRNREAAIARFVAIMSEALEEKPERVATKPSKQANQKRVDDKRKHGHRKEERGKDWSQDC
jgi:ribosome-associated protein